MNKQFQTFGGLDAACLWYCCAQEFAVARGEFIPGVIKTSAAPNDGALVGRVTWQRTSEIFRAKHLYQERFGKTHRVQSLPLMEFQYHTSSCVLNAVPNLFTIQTALSCSKIMKPINLFYIDKSFYFLVFGAILKWQRKKSLLINPVRIEQPYFILIELHFVHLLTRLLEQGCINKADALFLLLISAREK